MILDYRHSVADPECAHTISQHLVPSAMNELPLADFLLGVVGINHPENLHLFLFPLAQKK